MHLGGLALYGSTPRLQGTVRFAPGAGKGSAPMIPHFAVKGLRETFDAVPPMTVGIEEEVLLLDPDTLAPKPCAAAVLERAGGDPRLKPEIGRAHV